MFHFIIFLFLCNDVDDNINDEGILQDLPRTFPCHPWLNNDDGQASLRRVLVGYSFRDSEVGYCQVPIMPDYKIRLYY